MRQIVVNEVLPIRKTEVVEEAVVDRRTHVVLGAGKELDNGGGHEMGGAVAQYVESRLGRCWERGACLRGVVDDLVWHGRRFYAVRATAPFERGARISR